MKAVMPQYILYAHCKEGSVFVQTSTKTGSIMTNFSSIFILSVALIAISSIPLGHLVSVDAVEEGPCSGANIQAADFINQTWIETVPVFYTTGGSSYQIYRFVQHAFGNDPAQLRHLSENYVSNYGCFEGRFTESGWNVKSFNGANIDYKFTGDSDTVNEFTVAPTIYKTGELCKTTITLTDNKSFIVFAMCWPHQDQRAWVVVSTTRTLTPEVRQQVEDHVNDLGFNKNKFFWFENSSCPETVLVQYLQYQYSPLLPLGYAKV